MFFEPQCRMSLLRCTTLLHVLLNIDYSSVHCNLGSIYECIYFVCNPAYAAKSNKPLLFITRLAPRTHSAQSYKISTQSGNARLNYLWFSNFSPSLGKGSSTVGAQWAVDWTASNLWRTYRLIINAYFSEFRYLDMFLFAPMRYVLRQ